MVVRGSGTVVVGGAWVLLLRMLSFRRGKKSKRVLRLLLGLLLLRLQMVRVMLLYRWAVWVVVPVLFFLRGVANGHE